MDHTGTNFPLHPDQRGHRIPMMDDKFPELAGVQRAPMHGGDPADSVLRRRSPSAGVSREVRADVCTRAGSTNRRRSALQSRTRWLPCTIAAEVWDHRRGASLTRDAPTVRDQAVSSSAPSYSLKASR